MGCLACVTPVAPECLRPLVVRRPIPTLVGSTSKGSATRLSGSSLSARRWITTHWRLFEESKNRSAHFSRRGIERHNCLLWPLTVVWLTSILIYTVPPAATEVGVHPRESPLSLHRMDAYLAGSHLPLTP